MDLKPIKKALETLFVWLVSIAVMGVFGFVMYLAFQIITGSVDLPNTSP